MRFKTISVIKHILFHVLILAVGALISYGLFNFAVASYGALSFTVYIFAICFSIVFVLIFSISLKSIPDSVKYNENGIALYRAKSGEDFIPWSSVTDVEIWRLPRGNTKVYIFTEKYCNAYTSPVEKNGEHYSKEQDALKLRFTDSLLQMINRKRPDIEIKRFDDMQVL